MSFYERPRRGVTKSTGTKSTGTKGAALGRRPWAALLDAVFPRVCVHCRRDCGRPDEGADSPQDNSPQDNSVLRNVLCSACRAKMQPVSAACPDCGAPRAGAPQPRDVSCGGPCEGGAHFEYLDGVSWMWSYDGPTASALTAMKFGRLDFLSRVLVEAGRRHVADDLPPVDVVVPVPLHWLRRWSRGYDQARLIADAVADSLDAPVLPALKRVRWTAVQSTLDEADRQRNLNRAFDLRRRADVEGVDVLLVDDVLTTGATLDAAAAPLKKAGARKVHALTVARTPHDLADV